MGTTSTDQGAQDPLLHVTGNKLRKYTQHLKELNLSA